MNLCRWITLKIEHYEQYNLFSDKGGKKMGFEQSKLEYEGKQLLAEEAEKFLKNAVEDMKESAREQHKKDVENFNKIKAETKERHQAAIQHGKSRQIDIQTQISKARELGKIK